MTWTDSLSAQSGDFTMIQSMLTQANGLALENIYSQLSSWLSQVQSSYEAMIAKDDRLFIEGVESSAVASLKAMGLINSSDGIHIGPTQLGVEFLAAMNSVQ